MKRVTILAAMHGDEVYGIDLHEAFVRAYPDLINQVQLIIGNERAYQERVRFVDNDMNRHYGNEVVTDHESVEIERVEKLLIEFRPDYIIDIHTTRRDSGIFFISDAPNNARQNIYGMLDVDVCIMKDAVIGQSFIGNHAQAVSLEYSLRSISAATTQVFCDSLMRLVHGRSSDVQGDMYEVARLITPTEWKSYPGLKNYDHKPEGVALMVPADSSEMDAEYYGFWCVSRIDLRS